MYRRLGRLGPLGQVILFSFISLVMGRGFGLLGILCFVAGWYCIRYYPPIVRTVIFWVMCFLAGVSLLGMTLFLGSHTPVVIDLVAFLLLSGEFWLWNIKQERKYPWDYQERRQVLSKWEDYILYLAGVTMWICLTCIGFLAKGGTFDMDGKVITMDIFLQFFTAFR